MPPVPVDILSRILPVCTKRHFQTLEKFPYKEALLENIEIIGLMVVA